jgi:hypothetical protein
MKTTTTEGQYNLHTQYVSSSSHSSECALHKTGIDSSSNLKTLLQMGIERGELLMLVGTLCIVCVSGVPIVINVTDFEEGTEALISKPSHLMNRRVSNRYTRVVFWLRNAAGTQKDQHCDVDFDLSCVSWFPSLLPLVLSWMIL